MELIVLGNSASYALPDKATSGYLIRDKNRSIAIDIGTGTLSNLFRWQDPACLDALIISHLHVDHFADLYPLRLYLNFERPNKKLTVYAPAKTKEKLLSILSEKGKKIFKRTLIFKEIKEKNIKIANFSITFANMVHDIDSYAVKVKLGSKSLAYSSDTTYNEKLVKLATGCNLLLAEATFCVHIKNVHHMTIADAAKLANKAKVAKLLLTHIWPTFKDSKCTNEAAKYFDGNIDIAEINKVYKI